MRNSIALRTTRLAAAVAAALLIAAAAAGTASAGCGGGHRSHGSGLGAAGGGPRCGGCNALVSLDVAASALGLSAAQLQAELKAGRTLAQVAATAGVSVTRVAEAIAAAAKTALDGAVAAGSLTQGQAQAVLLGVPQQIASLLSASVSARGKLRVGGGCGLIRLDLSVAASLLGVTRAQLAAQLRAGRTLAQIAAAAGASIDALAQAAASGVATAVGAAVTAGSITAAQGQAIVANATQQKISTLLGG